MSAEAPAVPEVGMLLVDLAETPRTAAQWEELRAVHSAHITATERRGARECALGFLLAGACLAAGVVFVPDGGGWVAAVASAFLLVGFGSGVTIAFHGLPEPWHALDDITSRDFEDISASAFLQLPELAKTDDVIARYVQEVLAQGRSLRKAEADAIDLRVAKARAARESRAHAAQVDSAKEFLVNLTEEQVQRMQDQQVAVDFYTQNPSAALFDFHKRFSRESKTA